MNKTLIGIISLIIVLLLLAMGAWYWLKPKSEPTQSAPSPLADQIPDLNPAEKTNPFAGSYQNPFKK